MPLDLQLGRIRICGLPTPSNVKCGQASTDTTVAADIPVTPPSTDSATTTITATVVKKFVQISGIPGVLTYGAYYYFMIMN